MHIPLDPEFPFLGNSPTDKFVHVYEMAYEMAYEKVRPCSLVFNSKRSKQHKCS